MTKTTRLAALLGGMSLIALALAAMPAAAHSNNNHGTIKVHDDQAVEPATRNQPHVSCEFWVQGFDMSQQHGTIVFTDWPPTGNMTEVMNASFSGSADGDGWAFNEGPFELADGHYRVEVFLDEGHPGNREHSAKSKMFWVDPCGPEPPCEGDECPPERLPCPPFDVHLNVDGSVTLTWTLPEGADGVNLSRATDDGGFVFAGHVSDTTRNATTVSGLAPGHTYTFRVVATFGERQSEECDEVDVFIPETPEVPFFPTPYAVGLAALGAIGAVGLIARRRP